MKREGSKLASKIDQEYRRKKKYKESRERQENIKYKKFKITKEK